MKSTQGGPHSAANASRDFYDRVPGLRNAIEQRMAEVPEYRVWLEQHGHTVLQGLRDSSQ